MEENLVDNEDSEQGEPLGTMTEGHANIELMNALKNNLVTIGNHEFDYVMDRVFEHAEMADFYYTIYKLQLQLYR